MAQEITIPEIGENVDSGEVVNLLVAEGDTVEADQGILELETEKAVVEIPSPAAGTIRAIKVQAGDSVKVGQVVAELEAAGEAESREEGDASEKRGGARAEGEEEPEKDEEKEGSEDRKRREKGDEEEASAEREEAKEAEVAEKREEAEDREKDEKREKDEDREEGKEREEAKDRREAEDREAADEREAAEEGETAGEAQSAGGFAPAAPAVRHLARELGVNIDRIGGSGPGGRITARDVKSHARDIIAGTRAAPAGGPELPDFSTWGDIEREPLARVRRITAESTGHSWVTVPHVTQFDAAEITGIEEFRRQYGDAVDGKLTITPILLKVAAAALARFPRFNASLDMERGEVIYKRYYHIGVAVATDRGLLVPVIRNVDAKSIGELAVEVADMARKARDKKISPDEMQGGTFTISNQGSIGGINFTPIVYWPQAAILGVSRAAVQPVFTDGRVEPRTMLPLALSYDHRLIDGADAARFLRWISEALEHPLLLALERR